LLSIGIRGIIWVTVPIDLVTCITIQGRGKESTIVRRVVVTEEAMGVFSVVETVWTERILVGSVKDAS
ncbi:hypothetical protein ACUOCP_51995, partial [Escherichia sp. R-CC3]